MNLWKRQELGARPENRHGRAQQAGPENGWSLCLGSACGRCGCQGFVSKLGFGRNGEKIRPNAATSPMEVMPTPQFQWTGIAWVASDWHCAKGTWDKRKPWAIHCNQKVAPATCEGENKEKHYNKAQRNLLWRTNLQSILSIKENWARSWYPSSPLWWSVLARLD